MDFSVERGNCYLDAHVRELLSWRRLCVGEEAALMSAPATRERTMLAWL